MPMFDFQCERCAHGFEAFVRGSTTPACPQCASEAVTRLLSSFGVGVSSGDRREAASGGNYLGKARKGGAFGCGANCACH